jgi:hypothetical protein
VGNRNKLTMKKFLKQIFTLEPPLGEVWVIIIGVLILTIAGLVSVRIASEWALAALLLGTVVVGAALLQIWWQRRQ